jgi:membrane protease YdiL (CAAX protease family)
MGGVVVYNWLYHRSGQSLLLVMIIHATNNASATDALNSLTASLI